MRHERCVIKNRKSASLASAIDELSIYYMQIEIHFRSRTHLTCVDENTKRVHLASRSHFPHWHILQAVELTEQFRWVTPEHSVAANCAATNPLNFFQTQYLLKLLMHLQRLFKVFSKLGFFSETFQKVWNFSKDNICRICSGD